MEGLSVLQGVGLAVWLVAISVIDARTHRIPDVLSLSLLALGLIFAAFSADQDTMTHFIGALAGFIPLALFGEVYFRWRGVEGLGLGDAKLFGAAGAWLGWSPLPHVLLLASVIGLVAAICRKGETGTRTRIAFGPSIALAFFTVWIFGLFGS